MISIFGLVGLEEATEKKKLDGQKEQEGQKHQEGQKEQETISVHINTL